MDCYLKNKCKLFAAGECGNEPYCQYKDRSDRLFDSAMIPPNKREMQNLINDTDGGKDDTVAIIRSITENKGTLQSFIERGINLLLYSEKPGNGKTSCALQICRAYIDLIWYKADVGSCKVLFVNVPRYLNELKSVISGRQSDYVEHVRENILTADIVVFDDIATKIATEFEMEMLFTAIDNRLYNGKNCIFTSNTPPNHMVDSVGARIASRIIGESKALKFEGRDKRGLTFNGTTSSN